MKIRMTAAACLLLTTGCVDGSVHGPNPWLFEPGAAAKTSSTPLRERQVNLPAVLHAALKENDSISGAVKDRGKGTGYLEGLPTNDEAYTEIDLDKLILAADMSGDKAIRNSVIAQLMAASTTNCGIYLNGLRSGQVQSRLLSDIAATAFGIAGSLTEPIESARLLSGLAAFSTSAGASVDRNIFAQQGAELVADAIVQLRATDRTYIEGRMTEDLTRWPMGLALTDFARFHADCSMLRGLSQMREAVTAREFEVRAVRSAALAVARSGGSAEEVAAAIAGTGEHVAAYRQAAAPTTTAANSDLRVDLDRMRLAALKCFNSATKAFSDSAGDQTTPPVLCSDGPSTKWENRYIVWVNKALKDIALAAADNHTEADQNYAKANAAVEAAKSNPASTPGDIQTLELARIASQKQLDAAKTAKDDAKAKIETARIFSLQSIDADILRVSTVRSTAIGAIDGFNAGRPSENVASLLEIIAGDLATTDPAFLLSIKAAKDVHSLEGGTTTLAAANARATLLSVARS